MGLCLVVRAAPKVSNRVEIDSCSIAFSAAAFAYVGVDITAATALEARPESTRSQRNHTFWPSISVRFVATWTSFIIWIIYFLAGIMLSFNLHWDSPYLPRASFLGSPINHTADNQVETEQIRSNSGIGIILALSKIPGLGDMASAIILITVIFSANTNLYVASRALFVLARKIRGKEWYLQCLAFFGKTNNYQVPVRAMLLSCCFLWVPFLYLSPNNSPHTTITSVSFPRSPV